MVETSSLQERVELPGFILNHKVKEYLCRGHIFLNCSLSEAFCIAILEAAFSGLLVVSTKVGGVPEVLPEEMAILAEPNPHAMIEAMERAMKIAHQWPKPEQHDKLR
jgi:phosphatidylinositol glycan class A protein